MVSRISDLGQQVLNDLANVNKRVYVVGLFSKPDEDEPDPNKKKKIFYFGPEHLRQYRKESDLDRHVQVANTVSYTSFLDSLQPTVSETLERRGNYTGAAVGVPPSKLGSQSTERPVNAFNILYDGNPYGQGGPAGQRLLEEFENNLDLYLDFYDNTNEIIRAFNRFLSTEDRREAGRIERDLLPGQGVTFHRNFEQKLVGFLLHEDPTQTFDFNLLDWDSFEAGREWGDNDKRIFAETVDKFKTVLLDSKNNDIDNYFPQLRRRFRQRREGILQIAKVLPSKLMMSELPYWILSILMGDADAVHMEEGANALYDAIHSIDESDRNWAVKLPSRTTTINLPKPLVRVPADDRPEFRSDLHEGLGNLINIWADAVPEQSEARESLRSLLGEGLTDDECDVLTARLSNIYKICENSAQQAAQRGRDPQAARERTLKAIRDGWVSIFQSQFIEVLIGEPKTYLSDLVDFYVADHLDLYMQSLLLKDDISGSIRDVAVRGSQYISDKLSEPGNTFEQAKADIESEMLKLFTLTASRSLEGNVATRISALEYYVRLKAEKLSELGEIPQAEIEHSRLTDSENLPFSADKMTEEDLRKQLTGVAANNVEEVQVVEQVGAAAHDEESSQGGDASPSSGEASQSVSGPSASQGDTPNASNGGQPDSTNENGGEDDGRGRLEALIFELVSQVEASEESPEQLEGEKREEAIDLGLHIALEEGQRALEEIWNTRTQSETPESYIRKCRRVAMTEMMIAKHQTLEFGKDLSKLYEFTLDLLLYGPNQPEGFIQDHSLTKYYDLQNGYALFNLYERLEIQTQVSMAQMARFISEVRGVEYLFDQIGTKLQNDSELFIFNGSGIEFLNWVEETKNTADQQFWDQANHGAGHFVLPGLVYVLESAYANEYDVSQGLAAFLNRLRAFELSGARSYTLPPVIISTSMKFAETSGLDKRLWHDIISACSEESFQSSSYPCPVFAVGPARALSEGNSNSGVALTLPAGFFVVESIINGERIGSEKSKLLSRIVPHVDPDQQLRSGFYSLTRIPRPIKDSLDILIGQGVGRDIEQGIEGCAPIEGAMWLHMVALQYLAITQRPEFPENQVRDKTTFRNWYSNVLNTNDNVLDIRRRARSDAKVSLDVLGKDTIKYSIDFDNGELVKLGQRRQTDQETYNDIRYEAGWIKNIFDL